MKYPLGSSAAHPDPPELPDGVPSHHLSVMVLDVAVRIHATVPAHLSLVHTALTSLLAGHVHPAGDQPVAHEFFARAGADGLLSLFLDEEAIGWGMSERYGLHYLASRIKALIAETTQTHVFVHAGVVALDNLAIVLPAHSMQGKTTLVKTLVARGAVYFSDDVALFDRDGLVHPLPKPLSVRENPGRDDQVDYSVESLGGVAGDRPLRVGMVLFTGYAANATWQPREISPGRAALKLLEHTGSVRMQPRVAMEVLGNVVRGAATLWESPRGEATEVADRVLDRLRQFAVGPAPC